MKNYPAFRCRTNEFKKNKDFLNLYNKNTNSQYRNKKKKSNIAVTIPKYENIVSQKLRNKFSVREKKDCSICLDNLYSEDTLKKPITLNCGHKFHPDCLYKWISKNHTCPLCRTKIAVKFSLSSKNILDEQIESLRKQAIQGDGTSRHKYFFLKNKKQIYQIESEYFLNILVEYINNNYCSIIPDEILCYINENDINLA